MIARMIRSVEGARPTDQVRGLSTSRGLLVGWLIASTALVVAQAPPPRALTVIRAEGRSQLPVTSVAGRPMVSLSDLTALFQLTVKDDPVAGGITVTTQGKTIVLAPGQSLASVQGRLVSLPAPASRSGNTWLVPVEFLSRALALVHGQRIDVRPQSGLVIVGNVSVPRVTVKQETTPTSSRLTIDTTPSVAATVAIEGRRLLIRFDATAIDAAPGAVTADGYVQAVRVAEPASLIVDLGPKFSTYRAAQAGTDPKTAQLVIDLTPDAAAPAPQTQIDASTGLPPAPPGPPPMLTEPPGVRTVVIDPGHGGTETGARGAGGTAEKDVTLAVARSLKAVIESRLGLRVLLTRDADATVTPDERAALANNNKAHLFISLHANASVRSSVAGAQVFSLNLDDYGPEAQNAALAASEAVPLVGGGTRAIDVVPWDLAQAPHIEASVRLARLVEASLRARGPMHARALQRAPLRALVGVNMPAVLVEMGFLTHRDDERRLRSPEGQARIVEALFESVQQFRSAGAPPPAGATGNTGARP